VAVVAGAGAFALWRDKKKEKKAKKREEEARVLLVRLKLNAERERRQAAAQREAKRGRRAIAQLVGDGTGGRECHPPRPPTLAYSNSRHSRTSSERRWRGTTGRC